MATPSIELFLRGLLCNILVCLAVWCAVFVGAAYWYVSKEKQITKVYTTEETIN